MLSPLAPRLLATLVTLLLFVTASGRLHAALVWDAQQGWRVQGGALDGVLEPAQRDNALALMNKARAAEAKGDSGAALKGYRKVIKDYDSSIFAAEALFRAGGIYAENRKFPRAFETYQQIIDKHPSYERFDEVIGAQYRIANALLNGARGRILGVIPGFRNRARGIEYLEKILTNAPYSDYAPLALMNIARGHQRADDADAAIDALDRMVNNYPRSFLAPDAYLRLAQAHADLVAGPSYDQGATQQALTYFQDFLILFPNDEAAPTASAGLDRMRTTLAESKMTMGNFYYRYRANYPAARVFFNEAITTYPDSPVADRARELLTRIDALEAGTDTTEPRTEIAPPAKKRFWLF